MRAQDVVIQLASKLPTLTPEFTDNFNVISLTSVANIATAQTATPHGFNVGDAVNISGAQVPITITAITRVGIVATATTATDHDLTYQLNAQVEIANAADPNFNGNKTLLSVPNRRTFTFQVADTGSTNDAGDLLNGSNVFDTYNGVFAVLSTPTTDTFTYALTDTYPPAQGTITAATNARISALVSLERAEAVYTKQGVNKYWLFVVLGDVAASKNRNILSDAVDNQQRQSQGFDFRQQIMQPLTLLLAIPSSVEVGGRIARDAAEDMFLPICQSILFKEFNSGLFVGEYAPLQFTGHGFYSYNKPVYMHQYTFSQMVDLTFDDTVGYDPDVAFRDIDITMSQNIGTEQLLASIDLDDEPL